VNHFRRVWSRSAKTVVVAKGEGAGRVHPVSPYGRRLQGEKGPVMGIMEAMERDVAACSPLLMVEPLQQTRPNLAGE
jgi:hypothetical protein